MAIQLPNNKISRTLPEQVGFNSEKIYEIIKWINDSELKDKVIDLESGSGVLTDEQYAIAEISPSYIVYNGNVFIKAVEDSTYIDFIEAGVIMSESTSIVAKVKRMRITIATKAYAYSEVILFETYNKTQIESFVATEIAVKADLAGANFTGPITAPSIIENMEGYTLAKYTPTNLTIEWVYIGAVKNGNKLTLVVCFNATRTATIASTVEVCRFGLPATVAAKLYPSQIGTYNALAFYKTSCVYTGNSFVDQTILIQKTGNSVQIEIQGNLIDNLPLNSKTFIRIEQTFLLSDNLAE